MILISEIISKVQVAINDLGEEKIQRGIYLDSANDIAMDLAQASEIYINRYQCVPNPLAAEWSATVTYNPGDIVELSGVYYYCLIANTNTQPPNASWQTISPWSITTTYAAGTVVYDGSPIKFYRSSYNSNLANVCTDANWWVEIGGSASGIYTVSIPYSVGTLVYAPYRILRVVMGTVDGAWQECREYSVQSIGNTISGDPSFDINGNQLGLPHFGVKHVNPSDVVDNSLTLFFGNGIPVGVMVIIDYISGRPFANQPLTLWLNPTPQAVPDFMSEAFEWGLKSKILEILFTRGDKYYAALADRAIIMYEKKKKEVRVYTKNFKDNRSYPMAQPINWLAETY